MFGNKLIMLSLLYLTIGIFLGNVILQTTQIKTIKQNQITFLNIKQDLEGKFQINEQAYIDNLINIYHFKLYQAKTYNDIVEKFIDSNENWSNTRWIVYQGGAVGENKTLTGSISSDNYQNIYLIYIYQKFVNIVKIK